MDESTRTQRAPMPATVRIPLRFAVAYAVAVLVQWLWPGDDPIGWGRSAVLVAFIVAAIEIGEWIPARRYGRRAVRDASDPSYNAAARLELLVLVVIGAVVVLIWRLFGS